MIYWKDFALDEVIGALLDVELESENTGFRDRKLDRRVRDDSERTIQETGQVQRPARMVGPTSLASVQTDKDVGRIQLAKDARNGGKG